jgi:hypothetical protein
MNLFLELALCLSIQTTGLTLEAAPPVMLRSADSCEQHERDDAKTLLRGVDLDPRRAASRSRLS